MLKLRREVESGKKKEQGPSSFTKSLLFEKDQQLTNLKVEQEKMR